MPVGPIPTAVAGSTTTVAAPADVCGSPSSPPATYEHIVVLLEENRTWAGVGGVGFGASNMPYLGSLASQCTVFADWTETNPAQNSLTQYIGLVTGVSNSATVNDCSPSASCRSTDDNIFRQVRLAGGTARNYVEGATTGCSASGNAAKHVPPMYLYGTYTDAGGAHSDHDFCSTEVRPLTELNPDNLPTFTMISPDLCNDGHDCGNDVVDQFASTYLPAILDSASYRAGTTAVMVIYDEDHPVPNLLIAPTASSGVQHTTGAGHAAMLKTWLEMLGLPALNQGQLPSAISLRAPAHI